MPAATGPGFLSRFVQAEQQTRTTALNEFTQQEQVRLQRESQEIQQKQFAAQQEQQRMAALEKSLETTNEFFQNNSHLADDDDMSNAVGAMQSDFNDAYRQYLLTGDGSRIKDLTSGKYAGGRFQTAGGQTYSYQDFVQRVQKNAPRVKAREAFNAAGYQSFANLFTAGLTPDAKPEAQRFSTEMQRKMADGSFRPEDIGLYMASGLSANAFGAGDILQNLTRNAADPKAYFAAEQYIQQVEKSGHIPDEQRADFNRIKGILEDQASRPDDQNMVRLGRETITNPTIAGNIAIEQGRLNLTGTELQHKGVRLANEINHQVLDQNNQNMLTQNVANGNESFFQTQKGRETISKATGETDPAILEQLASDYAVRARDQREFAKLQMTTGAKVLGAQGANADMDVTKITAWQNTIAPLLPGQLRAQFDKDMSDLKTAVSTNGLKVKENDLISKYLASDFEIAKGLDKAKAGDYLASLGNAGKGYIAQFAASGLIDADTAAELSGAADVMQQIKDMKINVDKEQLTADWWANRGRVVVGKATVPTAGASERLAQQARDAGNRLGIKTDEMQGRVVDAMNKLAPQVATAGQRQQISAANLATSVADALFPAAGRTAVAAQTADRLKAELEGIVSTALKPEAGNAARTEQVRGMLQNRVEGAIARALFPNAGTNATAQQDAQTVAAQYAAIISEALMPGAAAAARAQQGAERNVSDLTRVTAGAQIPGAGNLARERQAGETAAAYVHRITQQAIAPGAAALALEQQKGESAAAYLRRVEAQALTPGAADLARAGQGAQKATYYATTEQMGNALKVAKAIAPHVGGAEVATLLNSVKVSNFQGASAALSQANLPWENILKKVTDVNSFAELDPKGDLWNNAQFQKTMKGLGMSKESYMAQVNAANEMRAAQLAYTNRRSTGTAGVTGDAGLNARKAVVVETRQRYNLVVNQPEFKELQKEFAAINRPISAVDPYGIANVTSAIKENPDEFGPRAKELGQRLTNFYNKNKEALDDYGKAYASFKDYADSKYGAGAAENADQVTLAPPPGTNGTPSNPRSEGVQKVLSAASGSFTVTQNAGGKHGSAYDVVYTDANGNKAVNLPQPFAVPVTVRAVFKDGKGDGGYGNGLKVEMPDGEIVILGHMASVEQFEVGKPITPGQLLGVQGNTGRTSKDAKKGKDGIHLHLEGRTADGQQMTPEAFDAMLTKYSAPAGGPATASAPPTAQGTPAPASRPIAAPANGRPAPAAPATGQALAAKYPPAKIPDPALRRNLETFLGASKRLHAQLERAGGDVSKIRGGSFTSELEKNKALIPGILDGLAKVYPGMTRDKAAAYMEFLITGK